MESKSEKLENEDLEVSDNYTSKPPELSKELSNSNKKDNIDINNKSNISGKNIINDYYVNQSNQKENFNYDSKNDINISNDKNDFQNPYQQNINNNNITTHSLSEREMSILNNEYTKQIDEIYAKNFKNELEGNLIYNNDNDNNINTNKNYLELERQRKLLALKNDDLERQIQNLYQFSENSKNGNNLSKKYNKSYISTNNSSKIQNYSKNLNDKELTNDLFEAKKELIYLDNRIKNLKEEVDAGYEEIDNSNVDKIKEIKIWRETFFEEVGKYNDLVSDLKNNLSKDKQIYINVLWKMKKKASENINNIFYNYQKEISDNEKKLAFLRKENENLQNKQNKLKEIYLYNFK